MRRETCLVLTPQQSETVRTRREKRIMDLTVFLSRARARAREGAYCSPPSALLTVGRSVVERAAFTLSHGEAVYARARAARTRRRDGDLTRIRTTPTAVWGRVETRRGSGGRPYPSITPQRRASYKRVTLRLGP